MKAPRHKANLQKSCNLADTRETIPIFVPMVKWLTKILLGVISLSFFLSAIEMDFGECRNTFFDEYDTYIKAEQLSVDHTASLQQDHDTYNLIGFIFSQYQQVSQQFQIVQYSHLAYYNNYPPEIFLRNSVWRI